MNAMTPSSLILPAQAAVSPASTVGHKVNVSAAPYVSAEPASLSTKLATQDSLNLPFSRLAPVKNGQDLPDADTENATPKTFAAILQQHFVTSPPGASVAADQPLLPLAHPQQDVSIRLSMNAAPVGLSQMLSAEATLDKTAIQSGQTALLNQQIENSEILTSEEATDWQGGEGFSEALQEIFKAFIPKGSVHSARSANEPLSNMTGDVPASDALFGGELSGDVGVSVMADIAGEISDQTDAQMAAQPSVVSAFNEQAPELSFLAQIVQQQNVLPKASIGSSADFMDKLTQLVDKEFAKVPQTPKEWQAMLEANLPENSNRAKVNNEAVSNLQNSLQDSLPHQLQAPPVLNPVASLAIDSEDTISITTDATQLTASENSVESTKLTSELSDEVEVAQLTHPLAPDLTTSDSATMAGKEVEDGVDKLAILSPAQGETDRALKTDKVTIEAALAAENREVQTEHSSQVNLATAQSRVGVGASEVSEGAKVAHKEVLKAEVAKPENAKSETIKARDLAEQAVASRDTQSEVSVANRNGADMTKSAQQSQPPHPMTLAQFAKEPLVSQMMQAQQRSFEQQANVKIQEQLNATLGATEVNSSDANSMLAGERRANLPLGLQTIPVPLKHPNWGQAFGQRVVYMANSQVQQAQLTLNPEKLGPIQIKLHMDRDQQMQVTVQAHHVTTREAIENALPRLREMLEQTGVQLSSVDVGDFSQFSEQTQHADGAAESNTLASATAADTQMGSELEPLQTQKQTDQLVDYYA